MDLLIVSHAIAERAKGLPSPTMTTVTDLKPTTARRMFRWQMALLAVLLPASAISNVFTEIADQARGGAHLPAWMPITWEFSSVVFFGCWSPPSTGG